MFKLNGDGQLGIEDFKIHTAGKYMYCSEVFYYQDVLVMAEFNWGINGIFGWHSAKVYREHDKYKMVLPYEGRFEDSKLRNIGEKYGEYHSQWHELWFDTVEDLNSALDEFVEELSKM